ncbi:MAG: hypothetical protein HQ581_24745 [Planctomycetes bacterium]|nr:hypothetical protein [Planctomycetota bacterium]
MSTAEQLAFSISVERRGIHVLLWDDQGDLVRALLVLFAALVDLPTHALLASGDDVDRDSLRRLIETRIRIPYNDLESDEEPESLRHRFWLLFLQQASSHAVGPWLNGWRRPLSEPPGALLVVRHADFDSFQRNAPDIASFVGVRIYDASTMISVFSKATHACLTTDLPQQISIALDKLPGKLPSQQELAFWIRENAPEEP